MLNLKSLFIGLNYFPHIACFIKALHHSQNLYFCEETKNGTNNQEWDSQNGIDTKDKYKREE